MNGRVIKRYVIKMKPPGQALNVSSLNSSSDKALKVAAVVKPPRHPPGPPTFKECRQCRGLIHDWLTIVDYTDMKTCHGISLLTLKRDGPLLAEYIHRVLSTFNIIDIYMIKSCTKHKFNLLEKRLKDKVIEVIDKEIYQIIKTQKNTTDLCFLESYLDDLAVIKTSDGLKNWIGYALWELLETIERHEEHCKRRPPGPCEAPLGFTKWTPSSQYSGAAFHQSSTPGHHQSRSEQSVDLAGDWDLYA